MTHWTIQFDPQAYSDLDRIVGYISQELKEPKSASRIYHRIRKDIQSLTEFPERCPRWQRAPWFSRGVRRLLVGKYIVFYLPVEETHKVFIMRVIYGEQDLSDVLSKFTDLL